MSSVFLLGSTGYIGGSVLLRLLDLKLEITVLVRSTDKAEKLTKLGVNVVIGSLSDIQNIEKLSSQSDIVFSIADADDIKSTNAILAGLKKRHVLNKSVPILIHTSGTGVLTDNAKGMFACDTIYDDTNQDQFESLPPTALHRNVDLAIVNADKEGYLRSYIILPSTIYGIATGRLVDLGIQNPYSIQIPFLIKAAIDRGRAGMIGLGKNLWPNVHIDDIADLYIVLYNAIRSDPSTGHGRNGYYLGENGEHSLYQIGRAIGEALVAFDISTDPEPTTFTEEEFTKYFGGPWLGTNSRCTATHSRAIGWKPTKTTKDLFESIKPEVKALLAKK